VKKAQCDKTQSRELIIDCSSKFAYDCAQVQYTIQHKTVLMISPLASRQTSSVNNLTCVVMGE